MKRVNIRVSDQMHGWYIGKSEQRGVTTSSLMNEALDDYMNKDNQPAVEIPSRFQAAFSGWHQGYDIIKSDRFKMGSFAVYCSRRNSDMTEDTAYKIMQRHVDYQYLSMMEWLFLNKSELVESLAEINKSGNRQNQEFIEILISADTSEKLNISQELFKYFKASKYEPSATFELMYQETLSK